MRSSRALGGRNAILAGAAMPERIRSVVSIDYAATMETMDADLAPSLSGSTIPVMLVRGGRSPFLSEAAFMRSLWLRHDLAGAVIDDTDHFVSEEKPTEVAALIRRFISVG